MNRKQLILLLLALVVLGGIGLVLRQHQEKSWDTSDTQLGRKLLPDFSVNDVAALHIKDTGEVDIVKKNDRWGVRQRQDYPANFSQISDLLLKIADLKIAQADPIGASQLARMHLAEPGSGPDSATLVEFKDAQGKTLQSLLLGKKHTHKSERAAPAAFGNNEFPDGRYVMLKSDPHTVLTISDPLTSIDSKPAEWLDKDFFKVENPKTIDFISTNAADSWSLTRDNESAPWVLQNIKKGEMFDTNKASSLSSTLSYPSFVDVAPEQAPDKTGLNKPAEIDITTFDHFHYVIKVGNKTPENDYNMTVSVTADFPTERVPGTDEKPADKKKLDQEFQDKLKPQQARLDQEKKLEHWTYLVTSYLIDPLIRPRAELMVDKKSDKKDSAATPEPKPAEDLLPAPDATQ
jgi:hypothetical protein